MLLIVGYIYHIDLWKTFDSFKALRNHHHDKGYNFVGKFGNAWPARVVEVKFHDNEISFQQKNGQKHISSGYDNQKLKMLRLAETNGNESIVVFGTDN